MSRSSRAWLAYAVAGTCCSPAPISASSSAATRRAIRSSIIGASYAALGRANRETTCDGRRAAPADCDLRDLKSRSTSETYSQIQANLADLQARFSPRKRSSWSTAASSRRRMGFRGLRIQSLSVVPADGERHYVLRLVLVQAIVHSRQVAGTVKLQLEGMQDGQMTSLDAADLVPDKASYDMAYEFRYFQGLECELIAAGGIRAGDAFRCRDRAE